MTTNLSFPSIEDATRAADRALDGAERRARSFAAGLTASSTLPVAPATSQRSGASVFATRMGAMMNRKQEK